MTTLPRKLLLPLRQCLVQGLLNKSLRLEHSSRPSLLSSKFFSIQVQKSDYQLQMWKRLKKHDPDMELFLNSSYVIERIRKLANCMDCSIEDATELIRRESRLAVADFDVLRKKIELFKFYKYSIRDLIKNSGVLNRAYNVLETRLATFEVLEFLPNELSLSILKYSNRKFNLLIGEKHQEKKFLSLFSSQENCIADILDCDVEKAKIFLTDQRLSSSSPFLLKKKVDVLKHYGFPGTIADYNIVRGLVRSSVPLIDKRMKFLKEENLLGSLKVSPGYLLCCKENIFEKSIDIFMENQKALEGCETKKEYLMFRLDCSENVAELLANKRPINQTSERKLKKMLDFFLNDVTASSEFIISHFYLIGLSLEKFQYRWPLISSSVAKDSNRISKLLRMPDEKFEKSGFITRDKSFR